jgi:hypothetical protein
MSFTEYLTENQLIQVSGYGKINREQIQNKIKQYFDAAQNAFETQNYSKMYDYLYTNGVLQSMLQAEIEQLKKEEND